MDGGNAGAIGRNDRRHADRSPSTMQGDARHVESIRGIDEDLVPSGIFGRIGLDIDQVNAANVRSGCRCRVIAQSNSSARAGRGWLADLEMREGKTPRSADSG